MKTRIDAAIAQNEERYRQFRDDETLKALFRRKAEVMMYATVVGQVEYSTALEATFTFPIYEEATQKFLDRINTEIGEYIRTRYPEFVFKERV